MPIRPGETRQPANSAFWAQWRADKDAMKAAGWRVDREKDGTWSVYRRTEPRPDSADIAASRETGRNVPPPDASIPVPAGLTLYPFQRFGVAFALKRPACLIADEMGLGKTCQALGLINADSSLRRVLVVCPASLKINWTREAQRWLVRPYRIERVDSTGTTVTRDGTAGVLTVINWDILHRWQPDGPLDLIVADESHYAKNPTARRSKALYRLTARRKLALTGTPILNRPAELAAGLEWLDPDRWGGKGARFRFLRRYCNGRQVSVPGRGLVWDFSGASNLDELQTRLRTTIMVRRLKKDVLTDLPAKVRTVVELPPNGAAHLIRAERDRFEEAESATATAAAEVRYLEADESCTPEAYRAAVEKLKQARIGFSEMARVRHDTAVAKVPAVLDWLDDALENVPKLIVFAHHHDVINALADHFGPAAVTLTGETPIAKRQAAVDRFQTDPTCRAFLGNIEAAGVGITLTAASTVVFCELPWSPGLVSQAEDRAHRIGQAESVSVYHLVFDGSIDSKIAKLIVSKQANADAALDDEIDLTTPAGPTEPPPIHAPAESPKPERKRRDDLDAIAARLTPDQQALALGAVRTLSGYCDGARSIDGMGFSKLDVALGRKLAGLASVSPRQAALCWIMARKYRRQLDENTVRKLNLAQVVDTVG